MKSRRRFPSEWFQLAGVVIAVVAGLLAAVLSATQTGTTQQSITINRQEFDDIKAEIASIATDLESLKTTVQALTQIPDQSQIGAQLARLDTSVTGLQTRQSQLEQVILDSPAKALEIPLLRRDIDNLKSSQQETSLAIRQSIDQVYDLNKWLLGAMAVSIVTIAIGNYLKGKETDKKRE